MSSLAIWLAGPAEQVLVVETTRASLWAISLVYRMYIFCSGTQPFRGALTNEITGRSQSCGIKSGRCYTHPNIEVGSVVPLLVAPRR